MDLEAMTVPELLAAHFAIDKQIMELREQQRLMSDAVHRKEKAAEKPGDPRLTITMQPGVSI